MHALARRALSFPTGRRSKFVVVIVWIVVAGVAGSFAGKLADAERNEPASFLPGDTESVQALRAIERFPSGERTPAVIVYRRAGGLTAGDRDAIADDRRALTQDPPPATAPPPPPAFSPDGAAALLVAPITAGGDADVLIDAVDELRTRVAAQAPPGLTVKVTGPAGFSANAVEIFSDINGTLLLAAASLVFVLLILIYRSPIFWAIPLVTVAFAEVTARGMAYGLTEIGVTVNGQTSGILSVLVFGAGTDYALLLVARYREELRRHDDKHEAAALALRRGGPAIATAAGTVIAALLCLLLADVNGTSGLGPVAAGGVLVAMVAMLTLLPAALAIFGRRAFWPFVPRRGAGGDADETRGWWRRLGDRVRVHPRRVWVGTTVALAVLCLGLVELNTDLTSGNLFRDSVESVEGQALIAQSFPAGANAPTTIFVPPAQDAQAVGDALADVPGVADVRVDEQAEAGTLLSVTLRPDPYSQAAFDRIPPLRAAATEAGGARVLVGGPTAEEYDVRRSAARDNLVIIPIVLLVVFALLALLLRALLLPLLLMATVMLSFGAALGVGAFFFEHVFGFAGMDPALPLYAFIFLVALGVDYNIFLMARAREETLAHGTREGMVRGLAVTGAVITSAGIVLAGTFGTLAVLPLVVLTEIGFAIAFGVLLDTFVVRSVLVPALVLDVGRRVWWPSKLARERKRIKAR